MRLILDIYESRSLTLSSVRLQLTPSSASRLLAAAETILCGKLFVRNGRGLAPTAIAEDLIPQAREVLGQVAAMHERALSARSEITGDVRIGILPSIATRFVPSLARYCVAKLPKVTLHVEEAFSGALDERLKGGHLDLAILNRYTERPGDTEHFLHHVALVVVSSRRARLTDSDSVDFSQLDGLPLVLPPTPNGFRVVLEQAARASGVALRETMTVDSLSLMVRVAVATESYTIVPEGYLADADLGAVARESRIVNPAIRRAVALALSPRRPATPAVLAVSKAVRELAAGLATRGALSPTGVAIPD